MAHIENLLDEGKIVAVPLKRKTINAGESDLFGLGVLNINSQQTTFNINIALSKAIKSDKTELIGEELDAINEIKANVLLDGFRGMPRVNKTELADLIVKLSELAWENRSYIAEMDINPIIANEDGLFPVDARIILQ